MDKAIFLIITFSLPVIILFPPDEHVSSIWLLFYSPVALIYPIYIYRKHNKEMLKLISYTPLIYVFIALPITLILNTYQGVLETPTSTIISLFFIGLIVGYIYFLFVFLLYFVFKKLGFLTT